ncbi:putative uncharacterized protein DDB_G0271606 [Anopheles funestus]|uniref:putative uncharacterized protein DDB_G0271606 n=1 Tax=Anopheles funestus TaxID=62324 RepID=UPI0020C67799|nr:putative uncharacterized protein DDB_G0271606 [Anopheles funestus]
MPALEEMDKNPSAYREVDLSVPAGQQLCGLNHSFEHNLTNDDPAKVEKKASPAKKEPNSYATVSPELSYAHVTQWGNSGRENPSCNDPLIEQLGQQMQKISITPAAEPVGSGAETTQQQQSKQPEPVDDIKYDDGHYPPAILEAALEFAARELCPNAPSFFPAHAQQEEEKQYWQQQQQQQQQQLLQCQQQQQLGQLQQQQQEQQPQQHFLQCQQQQQLAQLQQQQQEQQQQQQLLQCQQQQQLCQQQQQQLAQLQQQQQHQQLLQRQQHHHYMAQLQQQLPQPREPQHRTVFNGPTPRQQDAYEIILPDGNKVYYQPSPQPTVQLSLQELRERETVQYPFDSVSVTVNARAPQPIASGPMAMEFESRVWQLLERIDNADTVPDFYSIESDIDTLRLEIDEVLRLESILKQTDQQPLEE